MYRICQGQSLVLASGSPRRREMLARVGLEFQISPVQTDESLLPGEEAGHAASRLALCKAWAHEAAAAGKTVLAADTLVALGDQVLGKPCDGEDARRMISLLAGRQHRVVTGFCLIMKGQVHPGLAESLVTFRQLSPAEVAAYVASGEPMDKAGAYGVQGLGAALVERISGSYSNVVGLPLAAVLGLMLRRGVIEPRPLEEA